MGRTLSPLPPFPPSLPDTHLVGTWFRRLGAVNMLASTFSHGSCKKCNGNFILTLYLEPSSNCVICSKLEERTSVENCRLKTSSNCIICSKLEVRASPVENHRLFYAALQPS